MDLAFGVLVHRWSILSKPLQFYVDSGIVIVGVTMRLHNFCTDEEGNRYTSQGKIYWKKKWNKNNIEYGRVLLGHHTQEQKDEINHSTKLARIRCEIFSREA